MHFLYIYTSMYELLTYLLIMSVNCYECVNHVSFPCTIRYLNFGTKFPEGWVYVTTLVEYILRDY
jgi:hypothetical protein